MKVKIGDKTYSSTEEPIMVILDDSDKENINNMVDVCKKYCSYPESGYTVDEIVKFMNTEE